jgi:hypothetical protein
MADAHDEIKPALVIAGAWFGMGTTHLHPSKYPPRVRPRDRKVLFAVRYADGSSDYIRVEPATAAFGTLRVLPLVTELQAIGELPKGKIISVGRVR